MKGNLRPQGAESWILQWKVKGRPYTRTIHAATLKEAEARRDKLLTVIQAAILEGTYLDKFGRGDERDVPTPDKIRLSDAWRHYLKSQSRPDSSKQTLIEYEYQYGIFVEWMRQAHPEIVYLARLAQPVAEKFAEHIAADHAPSTFNKYRDLLLRMFRVLTNGRGDNPWQHIHRKKKKPNHKVPFTTNETATMFKKAEGEMKTLLLIGYYTALRLADVCLLLWVEIDWQRRQIVHKVRKTGKNVTIPIHPELYLHLQALFREYGRKEKHICPEFARAYFDAKGRRKDTVVVKIQAFFRACNIRTHREGTGPGTGKRAVVEKGFHSLRHTWVSLSRQNGTDKASVEAIVGWGNPEMEKTYTTVEDGHLAEAINRIPSVLCSKKPAKGPATTPSLPLTSMSNADLRKTGDAIIAELQKRQKAS